MSRPSRFVDFGALRAAVGMQQVLGRYGLADKLARDGDSLAGPCPIRKGDDPPRFRADLGRNCWSCASDCGCSGSALDFVARMEGVGLVGAANLLVEWFGLDPERLGADPAGPTDAPASETRPEPGASRMETYTVIAYSLPGGAHHVEPVRAEDATAAVVALRERLGLRMGEFEVVAAVLGEPEFAEVDRRRVALAPHSPASP